MSDVTIRKARREDCKVIRDLIQELANYENMKDGPRNDYKTLERDGFDTEHPLFMSFVAVASDNVVGHAIFYYTYSTWEGRAMYLEDLYVTAEYRKHGVGSKLLTAVAKEAMNNDCCRLDFSVLDWNTAQEFYKKKGAVDLTVQEGFLHYRFPKDALVNLAKSSDTP